jgi:hypothetical protein
MIDIKRARESGFKYQRPPKSVVKLLLAGP